MKKSDTKSIKSNNTALVLDSIFEGAVSRAEIVERTGLSKATVTAIVGDLIASGALCERGAEDARGVGRPRVELAIVPGHRYAVGISLHRHRLSACLVDLTFHPVDSRSFPTADFSSPEGAMDALLGAVSELCLAHKIPKERLIGIGVSCPGPLDYKNGIVHNPPGLSLFHHFKVREYLSEKTALPVYLDNNSVLLGMYEKRLRKNSLHSWIFIVISGGVGSAVFSDGRLFRGSGGYAGELGHTSVEANGPLCACGNRGCLEGYLSMKALRARFGFTDYATVVDAAIAGGEKELAILEYIADKLSVALVNCVNLFDPEAVVLYGELNYRPELLLELLARRTRERSAVAGIHDVLLAPSLIGENGDLVSSATAILDAYFSRRLN